MKQHFAMFAGYNRWANGRIYEGGSLAEKLTGQRKVQPLYWQQ